MPRKRLDFQIETIKGDILKMNEVVESQVRDAMLALSRLDSELAAKVMERDNETNAFYGDIKERCVQTIALQQPVAKDLRFISIAMDVASNLERIGDYGVDIAKNVDYILKESPHLSDEFNRDVLKLIDGDGPNKNLMIEMGEVASEMVHRAGPAFIYEDGTKIEEIMKLEDQVDELFRKIFHRLEDISRKDTEGVSFALNLILTARYLERIADHSINITKRTYYAMKGKGEFI
jgi:phosphate transport system protein